MYYEESIIDGILCWRNDPNGKWIPYKPEELTAKILSLKRDAEALRKLEKLATLGIITVYIEKPNEPVDEGVNISWGKGMEAPSLTEAIENVKE